MGQPLFSLGDPTSSLNAAVVTGGGTAVNGIKRGGFTIFVRAASVTSGGTVIIEVCDTDSSTSTDWVTVATVPVVANGTQTVVVDQPYPYIRANVSARTDGAYTAKIYPWVGPR